MNGFSSYISFGKRRDFHFGKDGPSFRLSLWRFTLCLAVIDVEEIMRGLIRTIDSHIPAPQEQEVEQHGVAKWDSTQKELEIRQRELRADAREADIKDREGKLSEREGSFFETSAEMTSVKKENEALKIKVDDLTRLYHDLDEANTEFIEEVDVLETEKETMTDEIKRLSNKIVEVEETIAQKDGELDHIKALYEIQSCHLNGALVVWSRKPSSTEVSL